MRYVSKAKYERLQRLSTDDHIISALAIDQRGSLRKMIEAGGGVDDIQSAVETFKVGISEELTPYSSSILLDPEYGLPAAKKRHPDAGLLLAYEETGYDATTVGRLPDLLPEWSARRLKEAGADAVKFLLYFDPDEDEAINHKKYAFTERIGAECEAEDMPFFLEIITYDANIDDAKGMEYARLKPAKVIKSMEIFSSERFYVDVLKIEVPVNMNYIAGFGEVERAYTQEEAAQFFKDQDRATHLPYIYLSAGVSMDLFKDTLHFAKAAGAKFNGVLCGRATWKDAVPEYVQGGDEASRKWLSSVGKANIDALNETIYSTAVGWDDKIKLREEK